jgi:hypothetical protein
MATGHRPAPRSPRAQRPLHKPLYAGHRPGRFVVGHGYGAMAAARRPQHRRKSGAVLVRAAFAVLLRAIREFADDPSLRDRAEVTRSLTVHACAILPERLGNAPTGSRLFLPSATPPLRSGRPPACRSAAACTRSSASARPALATAAVNASRSHRAHPGVLGFAEHGQACVGCLRADEAQYYVNPQRRMSIECKRSTDPM